MFGEKGDRVLILGPFDVYYARVLVSMLISVKCIVYTKRAEQRMKESIHWRTRWSIQTKRRKEIVCESINVWSILAFLLLHFAAIARWKCKISKIYTSVTPLRATYIFVHTPKRNLLCFSGKNNNNRHPVNIKGATAHCAPTNQLKFAYERRRRWRRFNTLPFNCFFLTRSCGQWSNLVCFPSFPFFLDSHWFFSCFFCCNIIISSQRRLN